jgi:hypothetical protein
MPQCFGRTYLKEYRVQVKQSLMSVTFSFDSILRDFKLLWLDDKNIRLLSNDIDHLGSRVSSKTEGKPVATTQDEDQGRHSKAMDGFREDWYGLCFNSLPSTKSALEAWVEKWRLVYHRGVVMKIPAFIDNDGKGAIYTFLYRIKGENGFAFFFS